MIPEAVKRYADIIMLDGPKDNLFLRKHPVMTRLNRAKIFAPFDALSGFDRFIRSKEITYVPRMIPDPEEQHLINRKLLFLHNLTLNSRFARKNQIRVTVVRFSVCTDPNAEAFGRLGLYESITGIVWNVSAVTQTIKVGSVLIPFSDICQIILPDQSAA